MNGRYLLDTSVVIPLMAGDTDIARQVRRAETVFVASITVGELYYGAHKSAHVTANLAQIERYVSESTILGANTETARIYGEAKNRLRERGHPIPENDIWIAAIAAQYGLTLATRDDHFAHVESLQIAKW